MKTLDDHVIVYDEDCPMCNLYTLAFVKANMLNKHGRVPYGETDENLMSLIDQKRACDEIALIDVKQGTVIYGIDSLLKVLSNNFPSIMYFTKFRLAKWMLQRLYKLVSYNRKSIMPENKFEAVNRCTPSFNLKYRWIYIVMAWIITSLILNAYSSLLTNFISASDFYREFAICGGQIVFQSVVVGFLRKDRLVHYLGNMMTVSLVGALLLLPGMVVIKLIGFNSPYVALGWFALVVLLIFAEHARRVKILEINCGATATWVLYRLLVLLFIL